MSNAQVNVPTELSLSAAAGYRDIFAEAEVDVLFSDAGGGQWRVPAFWAGQNVFRVRFAAPAPGRYCWQSVCSNASDAGLHGRRGEIQADPYEGNVQLYRRGRLRVAANRRTLEHADGSSFFWLGDTWWMGLTKRLDWPEGFRRLAADRVEKGFSLIQIVAGPLPGFDVSDSAWDAQQANEAGWPWERDWKRIDPAFYDQADRRIAQLVEAGLVPCLVGMWGYYLPAMGVANVRRHWRNLLARYGAYPVVWCLAGETIMPTYSLHGRPDQRAAAVEAQKAGWTDVARYVRSIDPFRNVVTTHPTQWSREQLQDDSLLDVDMLQTGHGGYGSLAPSVQRMAEAQAAEPIMPVVNGEACYENIMGASQHEVQRFLFWTMVTSGACGHTYGCQGIWAMSSRDEPFCGWTANWGDGYWQDVMHLSGSRHVGLGAEFFRRYPWQLFRPRPIAEAEAPAMAKAKRAYPFATGIPGAIWVFYLASTAADAAMQGYQRSPFGAGAEGPSILIEPGSSYDAWFFDPRTGREVRRYRVWGKRTIELGPVRPGPDGLWPAPQKPTMDDWVLVLEDRQALAKLAETR